ncbi:hypothetical protein [Metapseudomonas boanensis]|uniref:Uncharacterized protein n=1 Tax=Metapseudomonas boanensis TaxID=2822138 RepID=A0ABS5XKA8_9GAMM|nr:hypothetical protein [Pseudomonas boanensis]MBT8768075.1 hypothetical protein [Pseudomonas boanensis]
MPYLIRSLANIGSKLIVTPRDNLTIARRIVRRMCEERDKIYGERRELHRKARKLRQFEPFTMLAADKMEQQAREHRATELNSIRLVLLGYGRLIVLDRESIADQLGFEALADLLNINSVDRERARREGLRTLAELIAVNDLENSAERRSDKWGAGSPLYQASLAAIQEFIRAAPESALPNLFAPGELLRPKLQPRLQLVWPAAQDTAGAD